jgi:hypothetical protein
MFARGCILGDGQWLGKVREGVRPVAKMRIHFVSRPKPSLHFTSHQKFRLEEMVQMSILEEGTKGQDSRGHRIVGSPIGRAD